MYLRGSTSFSSQANPVRNVDSQTAHAQNLIQALMSKNDIKFLSYHKAFLYKCVESYEDSGIPIKEIIIGREHR